MSGAQPMVASGVGGVILFGGPPPTTLRKQLRSLTATEPGGWPLLVASDEEGGGVQRLAGLTGPIPWPRELSRRSPRRIEKVAAAMGRRLRALGVRVDFAPVADLDGGAGPDTSHPDGARSFSVKRKAAAADVVAFSRGLARTGIVPVVKHFPGLGTATANTDFHPATTASLRRLKARDLAPFRAAIRAGVPAVMMSHAIVPGLTSEPASVSRAATTGLLRRDLGFGGVVFTDSLSAVAISSAGLTVPQAAVRALIAGADDIVFGDGGTVDGYPLARSLRTAIVRAVSTGALTRRRLEQAAARVANALGASTC